MDNQKLVWSDGVASRDRAGFLFFVKDDEVIGFMGKTIPGVVVVCGTDYVKCGKWSHTSYRLRLAKGIRYIEGIMGWETGRFIEGIGHAAGCDTPDTWADTAKAFGVSVPSAMRILQAWYPKEADGLDMVERELAELEEVSEQETDSEVVTVSFGSPSNRSIRDGYWESPKTIPEYEAEIRLIDPSAGWAEGNIEVVGIPGTVLSVKHSFGMHGGYYAVSVAVILPPRTEEDATD